MIIGIDASRANRKYKGGTEWYSYYLIKGLAKIDSENQYILYTDRPLSPDLCDLTGNDGGSNVENIMSGRYQKIKSPHNNFKAKILNWYFPYLWTQLRLSWEMIFHAPDVLFIPAHALPYFHPKKSIVTIHDIGFEREKDLYSSDKLGPGGEWLSKLFNLLIKLFTIGKFDSNIIAYHSWSTRHALKRAKKIITVSEFTKQELQEVYGAPGPKIDMVYNGYNMDLYKPVNDEKEKEHVLRKYDIKTPYIFYVGRLEKKKNIARLVSAFSIMKEKYKHLRHKLVLAGNAGLGFDDVKYAIEEFDLNDEVIITGWAPEQDMPYLYSGAALFVFPSLYEGFGIPLLQAMAMNVPIAAARAGAIPEIAEDAAWLFNPYDDYDIAEKMAEILTDKSLGDKLIEAGKKRKVYFSLEKCARETLEIMKKL